MAPGDGARVKAGRPNALNDRKAIDAPLEEFLMRERTLRYRLWQALLLILFSVIAAVFFATLALGGKGKDADMFERFAYNVADGPRFARRLFLDTVRGANPYLARAQRFEGQAGLSAGAADDGAVILSRYDGDAKRGVVELVENATGEVLHAWRPDIRAINARSKLPAEVVNLSRDFPARRYVLHHPYAFDDGSLLFHGMGSPLVRIDACSRVMWTLDGDFHHSIERDADGHFWTAENLHPPTLHNVDAKFEDNAITRFSAEGAVLFRKSVGQILIDNGLRHLIYSNETYETDPIHINDVQPVQADGPYWRKGDVFLSLRHLSMVALYRPSTNDIVWSKQGPWMMQHDVDIVSDHEIAIFNNDAMATPHGPKTRGASAITVYDFAADAMREPFRAGFEKHSIRTETAGLFRLLPGGAVMVEEHDYGRLLAIDAGGALRWTFINRAPKDGRVFQLGWSRFLAKDRAGKLEDAVAAAACGAPQAP